MKDTKKPVFKGYTRSRTVVEYNDPATPGVTKFIDLPYTATASSVTENMTIKALDGSKFRLCWVIHDDAAECPMSEGTGNGVFYLSNYHQWASRLSYHAPDKVASLTGCEFTNSWGKIEVDPHHRFTMNGATTSLYEQAAERFKDKIAKEPTLVKCLVRNWSHVVEEVPNAYAVWLSDNLAEVHAEIDDPDDGYFSDTLCEEAIKLWPEFMEYILDPYIVPFEVRYPNGQHLTGSPHDWGDSPFDTEAVWVPCEGARENLSFGINERPESDKDADYETVRIAEDPDQPGMWLWTLTDKHGVERQCDISYSSEKEARKAAEAAESWQSKHCRAVNYATMCMDEFFKWSEGENYLVFSADGEFVNGRATITSEALRSSP